MESAMVLCSCMFQHSVPACSRMVFYLFLRPAPVSPWGLGRDCGCTILSTLGETFPWSSKMFPRRPRWFWARETFAWSGISRRPPKVGPAISPLQCSEPSSRVFVILDDFVLRIENFPGFCTSPWSCLCGNKRELWLWGHSHCDATSHKAANSREIWKNWQLLLGILYTTWIF